ncbi:hypothetical protein MCOR14_010786 [Pyricularia oryzae]|nr:hypothetical protein MCOR24_004923 [Pyricularia oryzae]KAI6617627.1 hypothetical protein MCOR14_010786 [Pyricularia oryzae]
MVSSPAVYGNFVSGWYGARASSGPHGVAALSHLVHPSDLHDQDLGEKYWAQASTTLIPMPNSEHELDHQVDLVVVGGGPTGLLSALLASRLGLTVSVLDAKPGPLELGGADALNARTQQYLEIVGILDELLPKGLKCNTSSTFADGQFKSRQSHWWTGLQHCQHKNFLMLGQPAIEATLLARLDAPAAVHYSERATAAAEDDAGVTIHTSAGRAVRARYAVAADGARSTLRAALGIPFAGTEPEMRWAVLDAFVDTDLPVRRSEIVTFELRGQSRVAWIPRERGMARFYVLLDGGEVTQQRAEASIGEHLAPHRVEFVRTEWFSAFDVKERIAETFISRNGAGRIILAGDAAHVHSVNGGQGLNTGIADAFALAWRLALVVNNDKSANLTPDAAARLMGSYDAERRRTAEGVIDVAARLVRNTIGSAEEYVSTMEKNAGYITGMGVMYDGMTSALVVEGEQMGVWKAGRRCPDILLSRPGGQETRLYAEVTYGSYLILGIGGVDTGSEFVDFSTRFSLFSSAQGCKNSGAPQANSFVGEDIKESDKFVVVVRPDMYIGFVGAGDSWKEYMGEIFKG